jgi:hypothetical protein
MKMIDLDQRMAEGKAGDFINWGISKFAKKPQTPTPTPTRTDPELDPELFAPKPLPTRARKPKDMDSAVWSQLSPEQKRKLAGVEAPKAKAPTVDAPKVDTPATPKVDTPDVDAGPSKFSQTVDFAKKHPYVAGTAAALAAGKVRQMSDVDDDDPSLLRATGRNVNALGGALSDFTSGAFGGDSKKSPEKTTTTEPVIKKDNTAPEAASDDIPEVKESMSMATLLKLTGQRPITERDNTMGIITPKAIQTLTEGSVNECGMGGMSTSSTPASISINATAGSGDEVANMLASIMKLAGVRPVEQDMMPTQNSNMPMMKALQIMGGPDEMLPPSEPDSMNANLGADEIELAVGDDSQSDGDGSVTVRNVDTGEEHVGHDVTEPGSITVRNVDTGEEFKGKESTDEQFSDNFKANTTPNDPTDVPKFDSNKMADMRNYIDMAQIPAGAPGDNKLPKLAEEPKLRESSSTDLFKAYEAFKNGI